MKAKPSKHPGEVVLEVNHRDESLLAAATTARFRLKNILVPIDFSECSRKALQYAIPLAQQHEASITLLYVLPPPTYPVGEFGGFDYSPFQAQMRTSGEKELAALVAGEVCARVPAKTLVHTGSPVVEITKLAKSWPADLIVLSTHGRTGLKHVLLGSVAENVVRHAPCPVLVVREREHEFLAT